MAKHEMLPVCERLAIELDAEGDMGGKKVASEAADNVMRLNSVTKDCLSVLATEVVNTPIDLLLLNFKHDFFFSF